MRPLVFLAALAGLGVLLWLAWSASRSPTSSAPRADELARAETAEVPALTPAEAPVPAEPSSSARLPVESEAPPPLAEPAPVRTPLHGRILDARTDEPVPDLAFELDGDAEIGGERLVTDAEGRFTSQAPRAAGPATLDWLDPPDDPQYERTELDVADPRAALELRLEIGPTYRLELRGPPEAPRERLAARLATEPQRDWARSAPGATLRAPSADSDFHPWVRLHPERVFGSRSQGPWTLELLSDDGIWSGAASVTSIVGRYPEVVAIELAARASLAGTVRDEQGQPVQQAWMRLLDAAGELRREQWHLPEGGYRADGLEPGRWTLEIDSPDHVTYRIDLALPAGTPTVHDVTLTPLEPAGSVRGVVTSATGTWHGEGLVALWGHEGSKSNRRAPLEWRREGGRWISPFAFDGVPAGTYALEWVSRACLFEVEPSKQLVSVPAEGLELRVRDDVETARFRIRARDATTGAELPAFDAWWRPADAWADFRRGVTPDTVLAERWPIGRACRWAVRAEGRAPVIGDERDLVREGDALVADVALSPGWGVQFFLGDPDGKPLEGVRLALDGVPSDPSDAEGRILVSLPARPHEIRLLTPGLRITGGDLDPRRGDVDDDNWWALGIELE